MSYVSNVTVPPAAKYVRGIVLASSWFAALLMAARLQAAPIVIPPATFSTTDITISNAAGSHSLHVEVAANDAQRMYGLMNRAQLPENRGMLFVYREKQPAHRGFWMYQTRIPLDIAFLDEAGKIISLREMQPCLYEDYRKCPAYYPGAPYKAALEVNLGFFRKRDIRVGDTVNFNGAGL